MKKVDNLTGGTTSGESHDLRMRQLREKDARPNILLIMTDQQRFDSVGANGAEFMHTPNMDRLAEGGCRFSNAFSPNPICAPARHNLLTGLTARYHKIPDNVWGTFLPRNLPTLPQILSDHGYETRAIGKNHFFPPRRHNGYDRIELMEEVPGFREQDDYLGYLKNQGLGNVLSIHGVRHLLYMTPQRAIIPEEHHGTTWAANRAINFIETNGGRHPWFLKVSWIAPHPPFNVPDQYADFYSKVKFPEPVQTVTPTSPLANESSMLGDIPDEKYMRRMRELYYGAISHIDHHLGRILESLEQTGQIENTLIIFTSDHGEMLGDHDTYQKWIPYDACSRIPLILHFPPKIKLGTIYSQFADLNDILPTILDVAGIIYPGEHELPGGTLISSEKTCKDRTFQFMEYGEGSRRWVSIRNNLYKYNYYYGGGMEELFAIHNDPQETTNLLHPSQLPLTAQLRSIKDDLRNKLVEWEERWGLEGYTQNASFITLPPYQPRPYRNRAFPVFQEKVQDRIEQISLNNIFDEVLMAIEKESGVHLTDLDLKSWQKSGSFTDDQIKTLLSKENQMRQRHNFNIKEISE